MTTTKQQSPNIERFLERQTLALEALAMLDAGATDEQIESRLLDCDVSGPMIDSVFEFVHLVLVQRRAHPPDDGGAS